MNKMTYHMDVRQTLSFIIPNTGHNSMGVVERIKVMLRLNNKGSPLFNAHLAIAAAKLQIWHCFFKKLACQ